MDFLRLLPVMTRRYGGGRHGIRCTGDMEVGDMTGTGDMEGDMEGKTRATWRATWQARATWRAT